MRCNGECWALAIVFALLLSPVTSMLESSDLKDDGSVGMRTSSSPPIMNNMSSLVEDGLAQFSGNVWVEPNDDGGYTVLNLGSPVWFTGTPYLTPGITVVDHGQNVLRRIELPDNITGLYLDAPTRKETCAVDIMSDDSVVLYCTPLTTAGSYSNSNEYLDFSSERIYIQGKDIAFYAWWNETDVFQDVWKMPYEYGACFDTSWKMTDQKWKLVDSGIVMTSTDNQANDRCTTDIGNTTLQCPVMPDYWQNGWQTTRVCDAIFIIGRNGSIENVVYSNSNGNGLCSFNRFDVGPYGKIEIQTGYSSGFNYISPKYCDFYDANGTDLNNRINQYGWLILDTDLGFLWDHQRFPCHNQGLWNKYIISDIEWTPAGGYYSHLRTSGAACNYGWSEDSNITDHGGGSGSHNLTVGLMDFNGTVYWNKTWRGQSLDNLDGSPNSAYLRASAWGFTFIKTDATNYYSYVFWDEGDNPWNGYYENDWSATFSHDGEILWVFAPRTENGGFSSNNCYDIPPSWGSLLNPLSNNLNGIFIRCMSSNSQQSSSLATQIVILSPDTDRDGYGHFSDDFPLEATQ